MKTRTLIATAVIALVCGLSGCGGTPEDNSLDCAPQGYYTDGSVWWLAQNESAWATVDYVQPTAFYDCLPPGAVLAVNHHGLENMAKGN